MIFSNYGGGFVEGDEIHLDILCRKNSVTAFTSQANTRVYRSENNISSKQVITGKLETDTLTVYLGDPLVPHLESIFEQKFHWTMEENAVLLFSDWFEAGRILNGERFNFSLYKSELKIEQNNTPIVWDRFQLDPLLLNMNSPAAFRNHSTYLNLFLAGPPHLQTFTILKERLNTLAKEYFPDERSRNIQESGIMTSCLAPKENVFIIRCSALRSDLLHPFIKAMASMLSDDALLGFDPLEGRA